MITIITVVYNDKEGLLTTINSVRDQKKYFSNFEYIVIDGASTDGTLDTIFLNKDIISQYISEPDSGIYDAMNKGIKLASGDALLFLNAGDYFVGNVLGNYKNAPVFLTVKYFNFFNKLQKIKIKSYLMSLPNCHQGIIFEKKDIFYDTRYSMAADYNYYVDYNYKNIVKLLSSTGYIFFDSTGISSKNTKKRDYELLTIKKEYFGSFVALLASFHFYVKRIIKRVIFRFL